MSTKITPEEVSPKFTPGPWVVSRNPDKRAGLCVRAPGSARASAPNPAVCRVYDVLKEREANARLIAAAPALYGALRGLLATAYLHSFAHIIDGPCGCKSCSITAARAALSLVEAPKETQS